ncbi:MULTISPECIES: hypothetical protein [unclassified Ruegeria]|uniref:DUF6931 family protein n=1 Tax=unclassified Ruegeria TaxID=2625375 RepID=UPI001ADB8243|nr:MULTISPECIES: hypothetical protein [unclassified Ruegeria]MBO9413471.1 hypothetical protein [Ruegeria sp. R8_1]MBO9417346.1 hypothetical protein [Ruegeria sp. R8_2]
MSERFANLTKTPQMPAARMLADANARLGTKLDAPASAPLEVVLAELEEKGAPIDMLRLLGVALPPRERVWWSCLAARDYIGEAPDHNTPSLAASEAWVFRPTPENREKAEQTIDLAEPDDETINCAMCALYADGTLGTGDLAGMPAPLGAAEALAFAMNVTAMGYHEGDFDAYVQLLIDRGLDIARGGNGKLETKE